MEPLLAKHLILPCNGNFPRRWTLTNNTPEEFCGVSLLAGRVRKFGHSRIVPWSKKSSLQDFQDFAKPSSILPVKEATIYSNVTSEERFTPEELDESNSFYMVEILTSKDFGSSIDDLNAAILLCLIDEDGNSVLQRISVVSSGMEMPSSDTIHFQRGLVDIVTFEGSKLGKVGALWLGLESGTWRLDGIRLTIINGPLSLSKSVEDIEECQFDGFQYEFEGNNLLIGEGGISVAELRPVLINEFHSNDFPTLLNWGSSPPTSLATHKTSNEEGMRAYSDLKLSLLLYDLTLVLSGSTILTLALDEKTDALWFFAGGISGFLYLLLLQKSVDGLSIPSSPLGGLKGPLFTLAFVLLANWVAVKFYGLGGGSSISLSQSQLFIGVAGFLTCKVAVVLAAFKPIKTSLKERE